MAYADVAVDMPTRGPRTLTYLIPPDMTIVPGQMVQIPLAARFVDGVVFAVKSVSNIDPVKPISKADTQGPLLSPFQLKVAYWVSDYYASSLYSAVALMLPPGARNRTSSAVLKPEARALDNIEEPFRGQLIDQYPGRRKQVDENVLRSKIDAKYRPAFDRLLSRGTMLRVWRWREIHRPSHAHSRDVSSSSSEVPVNLTLDQETALQEIKASLVSGTFGAFLLQGVTGSGKTEVYLQALESCKRQGKRAIVLVPEISLTPQTVERFEARFPGQVAVIHSRLSAAEHRQTWWEVYSGAYQVVIGSRSALFAPVGSLGLIVVDEEHEWTYKQQDMEPRYHVRSVATQLARVSQATLVLGSATPDVSVYHRATTQQTLKMLELPSRVGRGSRLAAVQLVDMRKELREGNRGIFSRSLQSALHTTIENGEQAILFLNRRGDSGVVECRDCGNVLRCASCDVAFAYHSAMDTLICHRCNRRRRPVNQCPRCRSARIRNLGLGTQRVVSEIESQFAGTKVLRWDRDAAAGSNDAQDALQRFARGEAQVLVGTQMVTKSLDIPMVTLVGVVLADIGLHLPDFRASERVFQLLCQVAGRAGRGDRGGLAIVQSYHPENYAVSLGAQQDYQGFYQTEIAFRRVHQFPPFRRLIRLTFAHNNAAYAERESMRMGRLLRHQQTDWDLNEVGIVGPAPGYPAKARGRYRWHIILKGSEPRLLLDKADIPSGWVVDVDPVSVS